MRCLDEWMIEGIGPHIKPRSFFLSSGTLGSGGKASMAYPDLYGVNFGDGEASCIFICATSAEANACCDI
eukprot:14510160-Ditylum_brightwellii.AAC.1